MKPYHKLVYVAAAAILLCAAQPAWPCSELFLTKGHYYASSRTMDFMVPMFSVFGTTPRGTARSAVLPSTGDTPLSWSAKYGSVGIYAFYMNICTEGLNEAGFSAAVLWCEDSVYPTAPSNRALSLNVWAQYFLDNYATVADAVADAQTIKVYNPLQEFIKFPLHLVLHDATGDSAVLEYDGAGNLNIYRPTTPVVWYNGVMTNEPFYPIQLANLPNYKPWGGPSDIPGDDDSLSRFVRGSYCLMQMLTPVSTEQATIFAFNFIQYLATPMIYAPSGEEAWPTIWTSVRNHQELCYIFNTWENPSLRYAYFEDLDFTAGQSLRVQVLDSKEEGDVAGNFYAVDLSSGLFFLDKPLSINPTAVMPMLPFSYTLYLWKDITKAFDLYVFAATPIGVYSIDLDGKLREGIVPILKNVQGAKAPISYRVEPQVILPPDASGQPITFYTVAVETGKIPPIDGIAELSDTSPYVIYMDKEPMTVK